MFIRQLTLSISVLLAFCGGLSAQTPEEVRSFQEAAKTSTTLLRGQQAERYLFPANGNPYWEKADYSIGNITVRGNKYYDEPLNIDAVQQKALVLIPGTLMAVSLSPSEVESMEIGDRLFVGVPAGGQLPEGIYEVYGRGPEKIYKNVRKKLDSSTSSMNGAAIGYYDEHYRSDLTRYFAISTKYYFIDAGGEVSRLRGRGALLRKFPKRRKEINRYLRNLGLDNVGVSFDDYCKSVINYVQQ